MTGNEVLPDKILSQAVFTANIDAPIGKIDIYGWLRTLPDMEHQRCAPPDHKACGYNSRPAAGSAIGPASRPVSLAVTRRCRS